MPTGVKRGRSFEMAKYEFLRKVLMQMFNDGEGGEGGQGEGGEGDQEPKMVQMTQEEFDQTIEKRLKRAEKNFEKSFKQSDEFKNFQSWQEGQKSEAEKLQEQLKGMEELKQTNADMASKIQSFEQKELLTKANVNPEFNDFVRFEIQKSMNDGDDFGEALEKFKQAESNAKYFGSQQQQQSFRQGQRHSGKGGSKGSTASSIISKMYGDK